MKVQTEKKTCKVSLIEEYLQLYQEKTIKMQNIVRKQCLFYKYNYPGRSNSIHGSPSIQRKNIINQYKNKKSNKIFHLFE